MRRNELREVLHNVPVVAKISPGVPFPRPAFVFPVPQVLLLWIGCWPLGRSVHLTRENASLKYMLFLVRCITNQ